MVYSHTKNTLVMRNELELLKLLKKHIYIVEEKGSGMCVLIEILVAQNKITFTEKLFLREYLSKHKPKEGPGYWFTPGSIKPRLNWLNTQINLQERKLNKFRPFFNEFKYPLDQVQRKWLRRSGIIILTPLSLVLGAIAGIIDFTKEWYKDCW